MKKTKPKPKEGDPLPNILIVEDDTSLRSGIALALKNRGEVFPCASLAETRERLASAAPDVLLLDVGLPDGSGLDFCREFRKTSNAPVVFLTCSDTELDEVAGFEAGADDYITKPFSLAVLRARVDAALRRGQSAPEPVFQTGDLRFDFHNMRFFKGETELQLSGTEQKLLRLLVENRGRTLPRALLIDRVWGTEYVDENALSVAVGRLRGKLEGNCIRTVYGVGYAWEAV